MGTDYWSLVTFETLPLTAALAPTHRRTGDDGVLNTRFTGTATPDHPATIGGTFENANAFENNFDLRSISLLGRDPSAWPGGRPHDAGYTVRDELVLAPTGNHDLASAEPGWEMANDGRWRLVPDPEDPELPERRWLSAGESFAFEYALLGRADGEGFPRDRYEFEGEGSVVVAVWETDEPGPRGDSRFAGADPPPLPNADGVAWYHDAGPGSPTYVEPSVERLDLPARVDLTFVNHGTDTLSGNPHFWNLWKLVDGRWFRIAPDRWFQPMVKLPPGGTKEYSLAAFEGHAIECGGSNAVGYLGGGRYAYEVGFHRDGRTHAVLLEVDAPPASVEPTDGLDVAREGSTVRVEWPRRVDDLPRATLTLTRADGADPETRFIPEQVMRDRNRALRNTLAFVTEADRIVLVTDRNTVQDGARTRSYRDGSFRFGYRDAVYEATAAF